LSTVHKNSSDLLLSIEAIELLHRRPEINVFVIVGGDRDYLPVVRRMRERLKKVLLVGFRGRTSGDLITAVGRDNYITDDDLSVDDGPTPTEPSRAEPGCGSAKLTDESQERLCMEEILMAGRRHSEIWLGPFLANKLSSKLPSLDRDQRHLLIDRLHKRGAISIEKREGAERSYSVMLINWNDNWVQSVNRSPDE
jgi:hypothetical protein